MTPERPKHQRPYEVFGISEEEVGQWRISDERLNEILANPNISIHTIKVESNSYGEFLFLTTSRGVGQNRTCMTFWGLGFHEYRDRWIHQEWFWHQTPVEFVPPLEKLNQEVVQRLLFERREEISPCNEIYKQSELGIMFESLADLTDDDGALAEMQDLGLL